MTLELHLGVSKVCVHVVVSLQNAPSLIFYLEVRSVLYYATVVAIQRSVLYYATIVSMQRFNVFSLLENLIFAYAAVALQRREIPFYLVIHFTEFTCGQLSPSKACLDLVHAPVSLPR